MWSGHKQLLTIKFPSHSNKYRSSVSELPEQGLDYLPTEDSTDYEEYLNNSFAEEVFEEEEEEDGYELPKPVHQTPPRVSKRYIQTPTSQTSSDKVKIYGTAMLQDMTYLTSIRVSKDDRDGGYVYQNYTWQAVKIEKDFFTTQLQELKKKSTTIQCRVYYGGDIEFDQILYECIVDVFPNVNRKNIKIYHAALLNFLSDVDKSKLTDNSKTDESFIKVVNETLEKMNFPIIDIREDRNSLTENLCVKKAMRDDDLYHEIDNFNTLEQVQILIDGGYDVTDEFLLAQKATVTLCEKFSHMTYDLKEDIYDTYEPQELQVIIEREYIHHFELHKKEKYINSIQKTRQDHIKTYGNSLGDSILESIHEISKLEEIMITEYLQYVFKNQVQRITIDFLSSDGMEKLNIPFSQHNLIDKTIPFTSNPEEIMETIYQHFEEGTIDVSFSVDNKIAKILLMRVGEVPTDSAEIYLQGDFSKKFEVLEGHYTKEDLKDKHIITKKGAVYVLKKVNFSDIVDFKSSTTDNSQNLFSFLNDVYTAPNSIMTNSKLYQTFFTKMGIHKKFIDLLRQDRDYTSSQNIINRIYTTSEYLQIIRYRLLKKLEESETKEVDSIELIKAVAVEPNGMIGRKNEYANIIKFCLGIYKEFRKPGEDFKKVFEDLWLGPEKTIEETDFMEIIRSTKDLNIYYNNAIATITSFNNGKISSSSIFPNGKPSGDASSSTTGDNSGAAASSSTSGGDPGAAASSSTTGGDPGVAASSSTSGGDSGAAASSSTSSGKLPLKKRKFS